MDYAAIVAQAAAANPMPFTAAPAPQPGLVAHVDGDYCAYYCAGNDDCDPGLARRNLLSKLSAVKHASGATSVIMHLTHPTSTKGERFLAATVKPYQGQRNSGRKPRNWAMLREYMENYDGPFFTPKVWDTREADDGIAYVAHAAAQSGKLAVISTADKDMRMLPGRHVIWLTNQTVDVPFGSWEVIGPDDKVYGHKWFWHQMIAGDAADNIPGVPRLGEVAAAEYLDGISNNADAFVQVRNAYIGKYGDEANDRMVEQACLLWLRVDRHAELLNFTNMFSQDFGDWRDAATRLKTRVAAARKELQELGQ